MVLLNDYMETFPLGSPEPTKQIKQLKWVEEYVMNFKAKVPLGYYTISWTTPHELLDLNKPPYYWTFEWYRYTIKGLKRLPVEYCDTILKCRQSAQTHWELTVETLLNDIYEA